MEKLLPILPATPFKKMCDDALPSHTMAVFHTQQKTAKTETDRARFSPNNNYLQLSEYDKSLMETTVDSGFGGFPHRILIRPQDGRVRYMCRRDRMWCVRTDEQTLTAQQLKSRIYHNLIWEIQPGTSVLIHGTVVS